MKTRIFIVRHGETDWNKLGKVQGLTDNLLNENGRKQALERSKSLYNKEIDLVYSSPLLRAVETAQIIKDELGLNGATSVSAALIERCFGELEAQDHKLYIDMRASGQEIINFESDYALKSRVASFIKQISTDNLNKTILITSHNHVLKAILSIIDSGYDFTTRLPNTAMIEIECDGNHITLIDTYFNDVDEKKIT